MLLQGAVEVLEFDVKDAKAAAVNGDPLEGFEVLMVGLRRAEMVRDEGRPWGDELVRQYQKALDHYLQEHGLRL